MALRYDQTFPLIVDSTGGAEWAVRYRRAGTSEWRMKTCLDGEEIKDVPSEVSIGQYADISEFLD